MTVDFMDSFDHHSIATMTQKWTSVTGTPVLATGRTGANGIQFPSTPRYLSKTLSSTQNEWIVGFAIYVTTAGTACILLGFDIAGATQVGLTLNADLTLSAVRPTATPWNVFTISILMTTDVALSTGAWHFVEYKVVIGDAPNGSVEIRINGTAKSLGALDTKRSTSAGANSISIGKVQSASAYHDFTIDDLHVLDLSAAPAADFLGDQRVYCTFPDGAGNAAQWAIGGSVPAATNWESVDEAVPDADVTNVGSDTANQVDTYRFADLPTNASAILAVQVNISAKKDDAGTRQIAPVVRPAATDRVGTTQPLTTSYTTIRQVYHVSPETSVAWDVAEFNGCEFGEKEIT